MALERVDQCLLRLGGADVDENTLTGVDMAFLRVKHCCVYIARRKVKQRCGTQLVMYGFEEFTYLAPG